MREGIPGRGPRLALVAALLASLLAAPAHAADQLDEDAYAAWVGDHAVQLLLAMQLPPEFTLGDLRDIAVELGELAVAARVVQPPPRFAAAHASYLEAMDGVERTRAALQTVVFTRRPLPELRTTLDETGDLLAAALRQLRDSGLPLPGYILGVLALTDDPTLGLVAPTTTAATADLGALVPAGGAAPPAAGAEAGSTAASAGASARAPADACGGTRGCAASERLRVRVLTYGPVIHLPGQRPDAGRPRSGPRGRAAQAAPRAGQPELVALRVRLQNLGTTSYHLRATMVGVSGEDGQFGRLVHVIGTRDLVPSQGLWLEPGETREGMLYFALTPPQPQAFLVRDDALPGGMLAIELP